MAMPNANNVHEDQAWSFGQMFSALPRVAVASVVDWARDNVVLIGSARSQSYRPEITPWTRAPIECANDGTRRMTFVKPIQSGGSAAGEIAICFWLAHWSGGDIQYNWPNGLQADERWKKHTEKKLRACGPVVDRIGSDRFAWTDGLVIFPHCNLIMQGVNAERALTADTIRGQVNEELHDSDNWIPGRLERAYRRTMAYWNSTIFNISNAGRKGCELHEAFLQGTQQHWEVKCPGCGRYHVMRARWEEQHPERGGLRYDMDGCRLPSGDVNYEKLRSSVRYLMPCGFLVRDDVKERRALSVSGRYSEPRNRGALSTEKSYTLEAVSVDYVPWIELIRTKHLAIRALKLGDPKPWQDYLREQECCFADPSEDRPIIRSIQVSQARKNREGLPNRIARFAAVDRQRGSLGAGELPHWWMLIQDVAIDRDKNGKETVHFLVVWEGRCLTDEDVSVTLSQHGVRPLLVAVDSSHDSAYVYGFCLRHGYNAVKVAGREAGSPVARYFKHDDESQRIFSVPKPLHEMIGQPPSRETDEEEPEFWHLSLYGSLERLHYLRNSDSVKWEVPSDVSVDFLAHLESWEQQSRKVPRTNEVIPQWVQVKKRDDLLWCAGCIAVQAEMAEIVGAVAVQDYEKTGAQEAARD